MMNPLDFVKYEDQQSVSNKFKITAYEVYSLQL